ncbi:MAG: hypothetical protein LBU48_05985, partial [Coriobacteriales bacterium]|nr:hypothetical protein [Coriobacteriales bacterium]
MKVLRFLDANGIVIDL